jgi:hypothetical protein
MDGIGEEFLPVFVDLHDRFLSVLTFSVVWVACKPVPEFRDTMFDGANGGLVALIVETAPTGGRGNAHGVTQPFKEDDSLFEFCDSLPQRPILHELFQIHKEVEVWHVVSPLSPQLEGCEFLHIRVNAAKSVSKSQLRTVKEKLY